MYKDREVKTMSHQLKKTINLAGFGWQNKWQTFLDFSDPDLDMSPPLALGVIFSRGTSTYDVLAEGRGG